MDLPALTPPAVFAFFRLFRGDFGTAAYLGVLVGTGALLLAVYTLQHAMLFGTTPQYAAARTALGVVAYLLAFGVFAAVAFNRYRTLYSALLILPTATLLGYDLLRRRRRHPWLAAWVLAVGMVEAYWVLGFWPAPFLLNAAALLVVFYGASGVLQHSEEGQISRAVLVEYGLLVIGGLALLGVAGFVIAQRLAEGLG